MFNIMSTIPVLIMTVSISFAFVLYHLIKVRKTKAITTKVLVFGSLCIAIATITSNIKLFSVGNGGSVTLCSMFFISVVGTWFGAPIGVLTGVVHGFIQILMGANIVNPTQLIIDYILAFGVLGLSGYFNKFKYGLQVGYIFGTFMRFLLSTISGFLFYLYNPNAILSSFMASLAYNASYMLPEMILTLVIISIPIFSNAILRINNQIKDN